MDETKIVWNVEDNGDCSTVCDDLSVASNITTDTASIDSNVDLDENNLADELATEMDGLLVMLDTETSAAKDGASASALSTVKKQEDALKKIGNVSRYKLNSDCIKDYFKVGTDKLKNVAKERQQERNKEVKRLKVIYESVKLYRKNMEKIMSEVDDAISQQHSGTTRTLEQWEVEAVEALAEYEDDEYLQSMNM